MMWKHIQAICKFACSYSQSSDFPEIVLITAKVKTGFLFLSDDTVRKRKSLVKL